MGGRQAFEIAIADLSAAETSGKSDVLLKFHVDDTTGAAEVRRRFRV